MLNISVIIPVYNAALFVEKAVNSALQFDEVQEILLIEDKSSDNSLEVCRNLIEKNPKIKLFQHLDKGNHGAGATRNLGLEKATQEFIAFLDADDYYLPNRFDAEKELFKDKKTEGVFGAIGVEFLSEKGKKEFEKKFKNSQLTTVNHPAEGKDVFYGLLGLDKSFGSFFHLNGLTIRKSAIDKNQLKFNEQLRVHQDTDFIVKLSYHCYLKSGNIEEAIAIRGVHDDNRITKMKKFSSNFNNSQYLLRKSIYYWAKSEQINPKHSAIIRQYYLTFKIANSKGFKKWLNLVISIMREPNILKTRFRFYYLKK